jgi:hypothetical protein
VERADLIARFHAEIRDYDRVTREQGSPDLDEVVLFSSFLDTAGLAVTALATEHDATFTMPLSGGATARLKSGAAPAIVVVEDDGTTVGVEFHPQDELPRGMVRALRQSGWRHRVFPGMLVTDASGRVTDAGPRDMRRLTAAMDELIEAGLASIAWSQPP